MQVTIKSAVVAATIDISQLKAIILLAVGGDMNRIAILDNYCWPDPVESEKTPDGAYKMAQLVRSNKALYDYTTLYKTPAVSGKDSCKNDSTRGGKKISIPPTLLVSSIGQIDLKATSFYIAVARRTGHGVL